MKQKDMFSLGVIVLITAFISLVLSSLVLKVPVTHNLKVNTADSITTSLPDINNDPTYNSIFNKNALDPAQPLQIDSSPNKQPFNGGP